MFSYLFSVLVIVIAGLSLVMGLIVVLRIPAVIVCTVGVINNLIRQHGSTDVEERVQLMKNLRVWLIISGVILWLYVIEDSVAIVSFLM